MSGESRLRHVAAMSPAGRGSISTEEAREVLAELDALEALRLAVREHIENPSVPLAHPAVQALRRALDGAPAAETGSASHVRAPFTPEQQAALADWQVNPRMHAFTCPNDGSKLIPRKRWVCARCEYTQDWAHAFMVPAPETGSGEA